MTRGEAMDELREALSWLMAGFPADNPTGDLPTAASGAASAAKNATKPGGGPPPPPPGGNP